MAFALRHTAQHKCNKHNRDVQHDTYEYTKRHCSLLEFATDLWAELENTYSTSDQLKLRMEVWINSSIYKFTLNWEADDSYITLWKQLMVPSNEKVNIGCLIQHTQNNVDYASVEVLLTKHPYVDPKFDLVSGLESLAILSEIV